MERPPVATTSDEAALIRLDDEARIPLDAEHATTTSNLHSGALALRRQHVDNLLRAPVAEELSERLLVIGDAVALDERDEIRRRIARQRGL